MPYQTQVHKIEVTAIDIDTMDAMSPEEYREYVQHGLFHIDHHDILRSEPAGYPIATDSEKLSILIEYLNGIRSKMASR